MDISILDCSWETQLDRLLVQPLVAVAQSGLLQGAQHEPRLFIIDGLDKCDEKTRCLVVEAFTAALEKIPKSIPHKLLFASRSESRLVSTCRKPPIATRMRRLHLDDSLGLSGGSTVIQLSPVKSFMDLWGDLSLLQRESNGHRRAEVDKLYMRRLELDEREEEIRKREEQWEKKEAGWWSREEELRKKEWEMIEKKEEMRQWEEEILEKATPQEGVAHEFEVIRRKLQLAQRSKEEVLDQLQKAHEMLKKDQEKEEEWACGRCGLSQKFVESIVAGKEPLLDSLLKKHAARDLLRAEALQEPHPPTLTNEIQPTSTEPPPPQSEWWSNSSESEPAPREPVQKRLITHIL